jgi:hypothetical protein
MTLLKKFTVYFAALAVSSVILLLAFKFASLAGSLLLLGTFRWMSFAVLIFVLAMRHVLRSRTSWQPKPLVIKRNLLK